MKINKFSYISSFEGVTTKDLGNSASAMDPDATVNIGALQSMAMGTGDEQLNTFWHYSRTLQPSASVDFDLVGSNLLDAFGDVVQFSTIKIIVVKNLSTGSVLRFGGYGAGAFKDWTNANTTYLKIRQGGGTSLFAPDTGYTVNSGTEDWIRLTNESASATCEYFITLGGTIIDVSSSSSSSSNSSSSSTPSSSSSSAQKSSSSSSESNASSSSSSSPYQI